MFTFVVLSLCFCQNNGQALLNRSKKLGNNVETVLTPSEVDNLMNRSTPSYGLSIPTVAEFGVIKVQSTLSSSDTGQHLYCVGYGNNKDISTKFNISDHYDLFNLTSTLGCWDRDYDGVDVRGKVVAVSRGNCTFTERAIIAQRHHAVGVLAVSNVVAENPDVNRSEVNIILGVVSWTSFNNMMELGPPLKVWMYSPVSSRLDPNMILIYAIAVSSIIIGAYWSGTTRHAMIERQSHKRRGSSGSDNSAEKEEEQASILNINACAILIMFFVICGMILLLYFFYDYLVYVVIGLFCLAGSVGLYNCLRPFWIKIVRSECRIPANRLPLCSDQPEYRSIALALLCMGFSAVWVVFRKASFAWILQDILGFAFCINMMNTILLPHFMACTILLVLLLLYDIFFVFITPLFTKDGSSVMVDVATGGSSHSGEQLPMVFKVPRFLTTADSVCFPRQESLLGFGDIIVPGLLIAYNHGFDLMVKSRRIYFIASTIAYGVGLIITYVALAFMKTGQPALLYLVPCTLLTTTVIGCKRGELRQLWTGKDCPKKNDDVRPSGPCVPSSQRRESESSSVSSDGERRGLINA